MKSMEHFIYKKEVDWSLLTVGITLPIDNQVVFGQIMGRFLRRGESQTINIYMNGESCPAKVVNVDFNRRFNRRTDVLQIRYSKTSKLAKMLQKEFFRSYNFLNEARALREPGNRSMIHLPDDCKEYLAIYTTEYDDTYVFEAISSEDMVCLKTMVKGRSERELESEFNYETSDPTSTILQSKRLVKIRKLNRKIGDNLKLLYGYRCQICGKLIGEEFGSHVVEAHHIDYFVKSLNNDADNQVIVCPNHHSIIHDANPIFDRRRKLYVYKNGVEQKLMLNKHL